MIVELLARMFVSLQSIARDTVGSCTGQEHNRRACGFKGRPL
jgi:hypothetical protein